MEVAMSDKQIALVTGANKGIGLQIAKDLAANGLMVLVASRSLENAEAVTKSIDGDAHPIQLDVRDQASITAAADRISDEFGRLDALVNNAGISHTGRILGAGQQDLPVEEIAQAGRLTVVPLDELRAVFETNVFGVVAVTQTLIPLLRKAPAARIVNVTSSGGSLTLNSDPLNHHRSMYGSSSASKTALNAVTVAFAASLEA